MRIIEIEALSNGAHRNQSGDNLPLLKGWAVIPEKMEIPNFPFGEVVVEEIGGIPTVTKWVAGTIPEVEKTESEEKITLQLTKEQYDKLMTMLS